MAKKRGRRGGSRKGAGRPSRWPGREVRTRSVTLPIEAWEIVDWFRLVPGGSMASSGEALVALVLDDDPMRRIAFANAYGSLLHLPKVSEERDRASATLETAIAKGDADLARIRGLEEAIDELAGVPLRAGEGETLRELRKELEVLRT